ncbi:MAG: NADH-quinone oxidoreductase subunit L, partial [Candidatus Azotimanducaceae bacterium]
MSGAANLALLGWIPALPLLGFLLLVVTEGRLPRAVVAAIGAGSMAGAAILTAIVAITYTNGEAEVYVHTLWQWMNVGGFDPAIRLYLDGLSLVMIGVITGVG